jgi:hypothetical protein
MVGDALGLQPLLPRAEGGVEADTLITMGAHEISDVVVSPLPTDSACTGIVSMEKQSPSDNTSCWSSMHT